VADERNPLEFIGEADKREHWRRAMASGPAVPNVRRDIVWAEAGGQPLALDAYWPAAPGPHPGLVWFHGGGWSWGRKEIGDYICRWFASSGYAAFTVDYRLAPQRKFPAAVNDCMGAVAWVRQHAEDFALDPDRIAVGGESAGANLAAMVAYAAGDSRFEPVVPGDTSVRAALLVYGAFDMASICADLGPELCDNYLASPDDMAAASPVHYVTGDGPPAVLVCGDRDILYRQSVDFDAMLCEVGVEHEFIVVPGAEHAFIIWQWDEPASQSAHPQMVAALDRLMK
jgi:acetyl esterase/lipase